MTQLTIPDKLGTFYHFIIGFSLHKSMPWKKYTTAGRNKYQPNLFSVRRHLVSRSSADSLLVQHELSARRNWIRNLKDSVIINDYPYYILFPGSWDELLCRWGWSFNQYSKLTTWLRQSSRSRSWDCCWERGGGGRLARRWTSRWDTCPYKSIKLSSYQKC